MTSLKVNGLTITNSAEISDEFNDHFFISIQPMQTKYFIYQPLILYCYILAKINLTFINQSQHISKYILFFFLSKHISNVFIIEILLLIYYHYEETERLTIRISRQLKKRFFLGVFTVFTSETINSIYGKTNSS